MQVIKETVNNIMSIVVASDIHLIYSEYHCMIIVLTIATHYIIVITVYKLYT